MIDIAVVGARAIAAGWTATAVGIEAKSDRVVRMYAFALNTKIQGRASGRPGPRIITGDYRRSWQVERLGAARWMAATNNPQGRRLESGFVGSDSLGRVYNQPPFPHVGPAMREIDPLFTAAMAKLAAASG